MDMNHRKHQPLVTIAGIRIALGPARSELIPLYRQWHEEVVPPDNIPPIQSMMLHQENALNIVNSGTTLAFFTIYERASWQAIGMAYLINIDHYHKCADLGLIIGEPTVVGRGYDTEAAQLVLCHAFQVLKLHSVRLRLCTYNVIDVLAYANAGFKEAGRRREAFWLAGCWWDEILMDCLAPEFISPWLDTATTQDIPTP